MRKFLVLIFYFLGKGALSQTLSQNFSTIHLLGKSIVMANYDSLSISGLKKIKAEGFKFVREEYSKAQIQNQKKYLDGQQNLSQYDSTNDALEVKKLEKIRQIKTSIANGINKKTSFLPTRNTETTALYYSKNSSNLSFLNENNVGLGQNNGSFSNNLISGYGAYFQISFLSNLSRANVMRFDSDSVKKLTTNEQFKKYASAIDSINSSNSTLVKIASGGGEGTLNIRTTLLDYNYNTGTRIIGVRSEFSNKLSFDIPIAGGFIESKKSSLFNITGMYTSLVVRLKETSDFMKKSAFTIYFNYDIARIGGTEQFYNNLNVNEINSKNQLKSSFWLQDFNVGFTVQNFNFFYTKQIFNRLDNNVSGRFGLKVNNILAKK